MNFKYKRVSRQRSCLICGKPDWCTYTPDGKISFCARIINNSDRVSRTGWGVYYHEKKLFGNASFHFPSNLPPKNVELAPIEIRDFAYRKLISLSPATGIPEIIDGPKGLRARKILEFENYGSLPKSQAERQSLAKMIRCLVNQKFPDYARRRTTIVSELPGFWIDKRGRSQLWKEKDYSCPMLLIPYYDSKGFIQACQIRFMCRKGIEKIRYVWLSTPEKSGSPGCGSPLHFATYYTKSFEKPLIITEGALKATTVSILDKKYDVLASAGVTCSHDQVIAAARAKTILFAFDADYYENVTVARALARLLSLVLRDRTKLNNQTRVKILTWDRKIKGIDDALLRHVSVYPKSPADWLKSLSARCQNEIAQMLPNFNWASL